jgi:hypothetical protein
MALLMNSLPTILMTLDKLLAITLMSEIVIILLLFLLLPLYVWPRLQRLETFKVGGPAVFFSTFWGLAMANRR